MILIVTIVAALASSVVRPGNEVMAGGLNDQRGPPWSPPPGGRG
jgi:hypothetical protein